jgi:hypothetical protein
MKGATFDKMTSIKGIAIYIYIYIKDSDLYLVNSKEFCHWYC